MWHSVPDRFHLCTEHSAGFARNPMGLQE
jgi:hypothetical protein